MAIVKEALKSRMKISLLQYRIRAIMYHPRVMTRILLKTRTPNLVIAKSRAK